MGIKQALQPFGSEGKRRKTCLALSCLAEILAVTPNTEQFLFSWAISLRVSAWAGLISPAIFDGSYQYQDCFYADHTFKGNHNFACQEDCFGEITQNHRSGPWGIQTWQK